MKSWNHWQEDQHQYKTLPNPEPGRKNQGGSVAMQQILISVTDCVMEPEIRAKEPKLNCLPELELKLWIAAPASFYLQQT